MTRPESSPSSPSGAAFRLRTLGRLDISRDGRSVQSINAQPKRLAVLTYLVFEASDRFVRRDVLMAMFWPESDVHRARNALNQTVHRLRASLGSDVLIGRGREELGIAPGSIWCDAVTLRDASREASRELAEELYRGPFLQGFHISGSPDFERWVEDTRRSLAQRAEQGRPGAEHRTAGGRELESTSTMPAPDNAQVERRVADLGPARWKAPLAAALATAAVLAGAWTWADRGAPSSIAEHTEDGSASARAGRIAVLPFQVFGSGLDQFGEAMVPLLTANLDLLHGLGTGLASTGVLQVWDSLSGNVSADQLPAAIAKRLGASNTVSGSIAAADGTVRLVGELRDASGTVISVATADGNRASLLFLVDSLTLGLVRDFWDSAAPVPQMRVSAMTSGSLEAVGEFVDGERRRRRGEWRTAVAAYEEALRFDPEFGLAQFRLFEARSWLELGFGTPNVVRDLERLAELTHRLPPREQALAAAWVRWHEGRVSAADSTGVLVSRFPDDPKAWTIHGETLVHGAPFIAASRDSVRSVFARVLALDPTTPDALYHALILAMAAEDSTEYAELIGLKRAGGGDRDADLHEAMARIRWGEGAGERGETKELGEALAAAREALAPPEDTFLLMGNLLDLIWATTQRIAADTSSSALPLLTFLASLEQDPAYRSASSLTRHLRARTLIELGRASEALVLLSDADPPPPMLPPVAASASLFGLLPETDPSRAATDSFGTGGVPRLFALVEAGVRAARAGDAGAVRAAATAVARSGALSSGPAAGLSDLESFPGFPPQSQQALSTALQGLATIVEGDTVEGHVLFGRAMNTTGLANLLGYALMLTMLDYSGAIANSDRGYVRGVNMLEALTRSNGFCCTTALANLSLARAHERAGERDRAAEAYRRVINLWREADPHLVELRQEARSGFARTSG